MRPLRTAILRHETAEDTHYDWLMEHPDDPDGPLWCARAPLPPVDWRGTGSFLIVPLPPHRRRYLTYEGPLTANRGTVHRVDEGYAFLRLWSPDRITVNLHLHTFRGPIDLRRLTPDQWQAAVRDDRPQD